MEKMMQVSLHEVFQILYKEMKRLKEASQEAFKDNDTMKAQKLDAQWHTVKDIGKELEQNFLFHQ